MFCSQLFTCSSPHVDRCSNPLPWDPLSSLQTTGTLPLTHSMYGDLFTTHNLLSVFDASRRRDCGHLSLTLTGHCDLFQDMKCISLSLYIYIYIHIYIYTHCSPLIRISIYLSIYLSLSMYAYIYIYMCKYIYVDTNVYIDERPQRAPGPFPCRQSYVSCLACAALRCMFLTGVLLSYRFNYHLNNLRLRLNNTQHDNDCSAAHVFLWFVSS